MSTGNRELSIKIIDGVMYYWDKDDVMLYRCTGDDLIPFIQLDDPTRIYDVVTKFT